MKQRFLATLSACLMTVSAASAASAAFVNTSRTVPVQVDGAELSGYLTAGTTMVPIRNLCGILDGWEVSWDSQSRAAQAVRVSEDHPAQRITACTDGPVSVNGVVVADSAYLQNGRTYIPLRAVCQALGWTVRWDSRLNGAVVHLTDSKQPEDVETMAGLDNYTDEDLYWLSRIISAESRGEPFEGQIAVGNVVLNRVRSSAFPNTIKEVVFDAQDAIQFEPVSNGTVYDPPAEQSVAAAEAVLSGAVVAGDSLYFYAPALSSGSWINDHCTYLLTIGCHRFYG